MIVYVEYYKTNYGYRKSIFTELHYGLLFNTKSILNVFWSVFAAHD